MEVRVAGALAIRVGYTVVVAGLGVRVLALLASECGIAVTFTSRGANGAVAAASFGDALVSIGPDLIFAVGASVALARVQTTPCGARGALARRVDSTAVTIFRIRVLAVSAGKRGFAGALAIRVGYTIFVAGGRIRVLAARPSERGLAAVPTRLQHTIPARYSVREKPGVQLGDRRRAIKLVFRKLRPVSRAMRAWVHGQQRPRTTMDRHG